MNFFLYLNKRIIFILGGIIIIIFFMIIFSKGFDLNYNEIKNIRNSLSDADISQPKFSINNESQKIYITASKGNFLNKDEVLLKEKVKFKSNNFSIETERVIFNRDKQTAHSDTRSLFKSENTTIYSDGFNIYDKGSRIIFHGNSNIVLK